MLPPKSVHPRFSTVEGEAVENGVSARLWAKFEEVAAYAQYNPFVVALAAGTLKMESLLNYLGQDLYYLYKYAEACEMARDCANDDDVKKSFQTIIEDTKKYAEETKKLISAQQNTAAVDYTSFLLATAAGKVEGGGKVEEGKKLKRKPSGRCNPVDETKRPLYSICSLTPCSRLYYFLGQEFAKLDMSSNPYEEWIKKIFGDGTDLPSTEPLLDKLAESVTGEEDKLSRLYYHGLRFEIEFFTAVPLDQRTSVPLLKQGVKSNCQYTITLSCPVLNPSGVNINENLQLDKRKARELKKMNLPNVDLLIVSDIWSGEDINAALLSSGLGFPSMQYLSKELTIFNNIRDSTMEDEMQHISIHIGYEGGLKWLHEADIGIVIGEPPNIGVSFVPLFFGLLDNEIEYAEGYTGWKKESDSTLYTVSSWFEICAFLVGSSN